MSATEAQQKRELWILGVSPENGRHELLCSYLASGGYGSRLATIDEVPEGKPLGIVIDISPLSDDGWGLIQKIKGNSLTRNIPVLPVFLSEMGKIGGVFPVAGFFMLPVDEQHVLDRLAIYGLIDEVETWDLQALVVSRTGEEKLSKMLERIDFEVVKAYTAKEAIALMSIKPKFIAFSSMMLPDMSAFELMEKFRAYPYCRNTPIFVLLKDDMKDGEKIAMSREIAHLVSKKQLTKEEFLSYIRRG